MTTTAPARMLWLELTGKCQLACGHCYASSGPDGDHGTMTTADWRAVIDQAAELGVEMIQLIGGEPTLHPDFLELVAHALGAGLQVEVYSNLVHVSEPMWETFQRPGVRLATSWYTDSPEQHLLITGRPTHERTRANIVETLRRGIPLRVGLVGGIIDGQRVAEAKAQLAALGVENVRADNMRRLGRAPGAVEDVRQLCGHCGDGKAAVMPDGSVAACPLARWLADGDVRVQGLPALLDRARSSAELHIRPAALGCPPDDGCDPPCEPQCDPGCDPSA